MDRFLKASEQFSKQDSGLDPLYEMQSYLDSASAAAKIWLYVVFALIPVLAVLAVLFLHITVHRTHYRIFRLFEPMSAQLGMVIALQENTI